MQIYSKEKKMLFKRNITDKSCDYYITDCILRVFTAVSTNDESTKYFDNFIAQYSYGILSL